MSKRSCLPWHMFYEVAKAHMPRLSNQPNQNIQDHSNQQFATHVQYLPGYRRANLPAPGQTKTRDFQPHHQNHLADFQNTSATMGFWKSATTSNQTPVADQTNAFSGRVQVQQDCQNLDWNQMRELSNQCPINVKPGI